MRSYDDWLATEPREQFVDEYCCYCQERLRIGDPVLRSPIVVVHKECFDDYVHETLEFTEEIVTID